MLDLKIDWGAYDEQTSIGMAEARKLLHGRRRGGGVALDVVRRWAKYGCRPAGALGPVLHFPAVKINHEWRTMPAWVEAFERARQELGRSKAQPTQRLDVSPRKRQAALRRADARLDAAGIGTRSGSGVS